VLLIGCLHQSLQTINIHAVEIFLRSTANGTCAVNHSVYTVYETAQAVKVLKVALNPLGDSSGEVRPL
jgi:hypothetical protein